MMAKKDTKPKAVKAPAKAEPAAADAAPASAKEKDAVLDPQTQDEVVAVFQHHREQILFLQGEERRLRKDPDQAAKLQEVRAALGAQQAGFRAALVSVPNDLPALQQALTKQAAHLAEMGGGVHWDDVTALALQTAQGVTA